MIYSRTFIWAIKSSSQNIIPMIENDTKTSYLFCGTIMYVTTSVAIHCGRALCRKFILASLHFYVKKSLMGSCCGICIHAVVFNSCPFSRCFIVNSGMRPIQVYIQKKYRSIYSKHGVSIYFFRLVHTSKRRRLSQKNCFHSRKFFASNISLFRAARCIFLSTRVFVVFVLAWNSLYIFCYVCSIEDIILVSFFYFLFFVLFCSVNERTIHLRRQWRLIFYFSVPKSFATKIDLFTLGPEILAREKKSHINCILRA